VPKSIASPPRPAHTPAMHSASLDTVITSVAFVNRDGFNYLNDPESTTIYEEGKKKRAEKKERNGVGNGACAPAITESPE